MTPGSPMAWACPEAQCGKRNVCAVPSVGGHVECQHCRTPFRVTERDGDRIRLVQVGRVVVPVTPPIDPTKRTAGEPHGESFLERLRRIGAGEDPDVPPPLGPPVAMQWTDVSASIPEEPSWAPKLLRYEGRTAPWVCPHGGHSTEAEMVACLLEHDKAMAEHEKVI